VPLEDGDHYASLHARSWLLFTPYSLFLFRALPPSRATTPTHQRTFSLTDAPERSSLPRLSHVSLTRGDAMLRCTNICRRSAIIIADVRFVGALGPLATCKVNCISVPLLTLTRDAIHEDSSSSPSDFLSSSA